MQKLTQRPIFFVNFSLFWGGGEKWHLLAAGELFRRGYPVKILVHSRSELAKMAARAGVPYADFPVGPQSFLNPVLLSQLAAYLKHEQPAAVILNGSRELKTIGFLAAFIRVPHIIYRRGIPRPIRPNWLNRFFFTHVATHILVNSHATHQAIHDILALPECAPVTLLYNGLDPQTAHHAHIRSQRIGVVARLSPEKGVDLAIQAFQHIVRDQPAAKLRIIGDGPERANLEALAQTLHVAEQVEFTGFVDDIFTPLSECAMLILPSRWEGFGNVLLEAMLLGMPCLAFSHTSAAEIIADGVTGYLVEPEDVMKLAAQALSLLSDPDKSERMGQAGYERLRTHFTLQHSIDQLENLLGLKRET